MITKRELIEKIQDALAGGEMVADLQSRYHPDIIASHVAEAYDFLLVNGYRQSSASVRGKDHSMLDNYTKTFPAVPVEYDSEREENFVDLPVPVVVLPDNDGIRMVAYQKDQTKQLAPISNNANFVFSELECGIISEQGTYYVETNRIYTQFVGIPPKNVLLKLVVSFDDLEDNDYIDEPNLVTKSGVLTIYDIVMGRLSNKSPEKVVDDNNSMA